MTLPEDLSCTSILANELLILHSIYPDEYTFTKSQKPPTHPPKESPQSALFSPESGRGNGKLTMILRPATAGDAKQQNISVILELLLPPDYPNALPLIRFSQPRGLSELQLTQLAKEMQEEAEKRRGQAMLYDLIDVLREFLNKTNFPSVQCPFCLCDIEEGDEFFKTECFHYCHMYCLRRYLDFLGREKIGQQLGRLVYNCIVCRMDFTEPINLHQSSGLLEPKSLAVLPAVVSLPEHSQTTKETEWRQQVFEKQRLQSGLIEPEPEETFVITLNHIPEVERQIHLQLSAHEC